MPSTRPSAAPRGDEALALLGLVPQDEGAADAAAPGTVAGSPTVSGWRVAEARAKARLTGTQLGDLVGLRRDQISKIETGQRRLAPRELPGFATALGVTIRYLIGGEESPRMALAHRLSQPSDADSRAMDELPATQQHALDLLNVEDVLASQLEVPQPRLSAPGGQVLQFAGNELRRRPRNRAEAQRQGRRLAEEVRAALDHGSAEIRDLSALIETHFAADVALSPLGKGVDGLCAHTEHQALLVASTDFPDGHVRFTLAHELGHHLLGDPREVIAEGTGDMYAEDILERRVNAFAAHLLMPEEGVREALAWLGVDAEALRSGNLTAQRALGTLMQRFGVSLQALLIQLADLRILSFEEAQLLKSKLKASTVSEHALSVHRLTGSPALSHEPVTGTVRPPQRLLDAALVAARAGTIGTGTVARLLQRPDDDELFDAVMGDDPEDDSEGDSSPIMFDDE